jgi:hypothetical protein
MSCTDGRLCGWTKYSKLSTYLPSCLRIFIKYCEHRYLTKRQGPLQWAARSTLLVARIETGCTFKSDTSPQSVWAYLSKYRQMSSKFSSDEAECVTLNLENAEWRVVTRLNAVCVTTFGYELLKFILWRKTHIYLIPFLPVIQFTTYPPSLHVSTLKQGPASQNTTIKCYLHKILRYLE